MKVLIEIRRETWSRVRHYATLRDLNLGEAAERLLEDSLSQLGQSQQKVAE